MIPDARGFSDGGDSGEQALTDRSRDYQRSAFRQGGHQRGRQADFQIVGQSNILRLEVDVMPLVVNVELRLNSMALVCRANRCDAKRLGIGRPAVRHVRLIGDVHVVLHQARCLAGSHTPAPVRVTGPAPRSVTPGPMSFFVTPGDDLNPGSVTSDADSIKSGVRAIYGGPLRITGPSGSRRQTRSDGKASGRHSSRDR